MNKKLIIVLSSVILMILLSSFSFFDEEQVNYEIEQKENVDVESEPDKKIFVQISGAIQKPGLYEMKKGDRLNDLLKKAEGTKYNGKCVNLARKLIDEENIYIPNQNKKCIEKKTIDEDGTVNINSASSYELQTISGIGVSKSEAIVEYRQENGSFEQVEDLLKIDGISEKLLASIKEDIRLS